MRTHNVIARGERQRRAAAKENCSSLAFRDGCTPYNVSVVRALSPCPCPDHARVGGADTAARRDQTSPRQRGRRARRTSSRAARGSAVPRAGESLGRLTNARGRRSTSRGACDARRFRSRLDGARARPEGPEEKGSRVPFFSPRGRRVQRRAGAPRALKNGSKNLLVTQTHRRRIPNAPPTAHAKRLP